MCCCRRNDEASERPIYEIRVGGQLDQAWEAWFGGLTVTSGEPGETLLVGSVVDQAALFGLLKKVRDAGLVLISVNLLAAKKKEKER